MYLIYKLNTNLGNVQLGPTISGILVADNASGIPYFRWNNTNGTTKKQVVMTSNGQYTYQTTTDGGQNWTGTNPFSALATTATVSGKVSKSGDSMTGDLTIAGNKAIKTTDSAGHTYTLIKDNGTNIWIGAQSSASTHHTGQTFISTGYNATNKAGNETIAVSVPNATNTGATSYNVWHTGNFPRSHASSATTYGVGTTGNYGHNKTINNLTSSSFTNGQSLSAYQGYVLKNSYCKNIVARVLWSVDNQSIAANGTLDKNINVAIPSGYKILNCHTNITTTSYGMTYRTMTGSTTASACTVNVGVRNIRASSISVNIDGTLYVIRSI